MKKGLVPIAEITRFDAIIDARSPAEFADDHIPQAHNLPVLDNEQRRIVGTIFKQRSAFEAKRIGSAMVAANLARHIEQCFQDKPKDWRPLVYCWRGGLRSASFVSWLRMVGWDACQLEGGYKSWRRHVIVQLENLPPTLELRVIAGPTGSGKTRVLEALAGLGEQVIDLEALAAHKGSVLGALPTREQPSQKSFETALHACLAQLDPQRPIYIEAESRKIGRLHLPAALVQTMRAAPCVHIEASRTARLDFLLRDYAYLGDDPAYLQARIDRLSGLQSKARLEHWKQLAAARALPELFEAFIDQHYDPLYKRSQQHNYLNFTNAGRIETSDLSPAGIVELARAIVAGA